MGLAGPAVSLVPLILAKNSCGLGMAVACLTAFMGLQAFAYSGFHAYVQARPGWALSFCRNLSLSLFDVQSCSPKCRQAAAGALWEGLQWSMPLPLM